MFIALMLDNYLDSGRLQIHHLNTYLGDVFVIN